MVKNITVLAVETSASMNKKNHKNRLSNESDIS